MADSVYNSTTVSYENPGPGSPNLRPWNLSEMVAPPVPRKTWFHWGLLWLGILGVGFGTPVCIFEFFRYATTDDSNHHSLIAALLAFIMAVIGCSLLLFYYKLTTNPSFCLRVANTRNAFRKVITKPRFQNAQARSGATLLTNEPNSFQPTLSTQYDPVPDIGFDQNNGDTSEERAKLMMHEAKDGRPVIILDDDDERLEFDEPQDIRNAYKSGRLPGLEWGYIGDLRRTSSMHGSDKKSSTGALASTSSQSHYKPRHFAAHGYGSGRGRAAPLASMEDITPSLRSSFASVLMYPPSSWGESDESLPSEFFSNDYENGSLKKQGSFSALSVQSDFQ